MDYKSKAKINRMKKRGPYHITNIKQREEAMKLKALGLTAKEVSKKTGIKMKTIRSIQKIERKCLYKPIIERVIQLYHQEFDDAKLKLFLVKRRVKRLIEFNEDEKLSSLIEEFPKKFNHHNRRIIDKIARQVLQESDQSNNKANEIPTKVEEEEPQKKQDEKQEYKEDEEIEQNQQQYLFDFSMQNFGIPLHHIFVPYILFDLSKR